MEGLQARLEQQGLVKKVVAPAAAPVAVKSSTGLQSTIIGAQLVHQHWKDVDLEGKRKAWEEACLDIANAQENSSASRKALAESTKAFRQKTDDEKLSGWGTFLKSYQAEIDSLTKRSKAAEMSFLNVYKAMRDVPDPSTTLADVVEELHSVIPLQAQHDKMESELRQYEEEFSKLKNQDVTIRKLEERIEELQEQSEDIIAAALEKERARLEEMQSKHVVDHERKNRELLAKIDEHRAQNSELRKQYDDAQAMHLDLQMKYEREQQAKQQQLDLVSEDLERSMARASALEREKEGINQQYLDLWKKQYQAQDTGARADQSAAATATSARVAELETTLVGKEALCKQLQLQVEVLEGTLEKERAGARESASVTARLAAEKDAEVASLKQKIAELPTLEEYAKVKRQLRVVQAVEYNMLESDTLEEGGGSAGDNDDLDEAGRETLRLEEMLMAKNQQLEKRVAESNRLMDTKVEEVRLLQLRERTLEAKVEEQTALVARLEEDLAKSSSGGVKTAGGFGSDHLNALLVQPSDKDVEVGSGDSSLAGAVAQQRDRFRQMNVELEGENSVLKKRVASCEADIRTLRGDNVKMYEKIKYLESYKPGQGGNRPGHAADVESGDANIERYKTAYEDSINPFTVFNQKQRALRREKMDPAERMLLEASHFFLGHAAGRKFLFFYMVIMHFLVFSTLYNFTHTHERCKKIAAQALDLPAAAAAQQMVLAAQKGTGGGIGAQAAQQALQAAKQAVKKSARRLMGIVW